MAGETIVFKNQSIYPISLLRAEVILDEALMFDSFGGDTRPHHPRKGDFIPFEP
jgi:hypothetical protein